MTRFVTSLARRFWPDFDSLTNNDRLQLLFNLFGTLWSIPWIIAALIWLISWTDVGLLRDQWPVLTLFLALGVLFSRFSFFQVIKLGGEKHSSSSSSLSHMILFSAYFSFGPTAVWLHFLSILAQYIPNWPRSASRLQRWALIRNLAYNLGAETVNTLFALTLYNLAGGQYPLSDLTFLGILPALLAILAYCSISGLIMLSWWQLARRLDLSPQAVTEDFDSLARRSLAFLLVANVPSLWGILGAAVYSQMEGLAFLLLASAGFLVSLLTRQLSRAVILSQQKTDELDQLEQLGRAIIAAPADASTLPQLLAQHVPEMMSYDQIEIRLFDGRTLLQLPEYHRPVSESVWTWLEENPRPTEVRQGEVLPWSDETNLHLLVVNPILAEEAQEPLGGIFLLQNPALLIDISTDLQPALQVLASLIASALHAAEILAKTLEHQRVAQELAFAGQIQASFLPNQPPTIAGWQLAATLLPAKETSGDFYDFIPLSNDRLGIVVADVTDKGMGAALFMALSRTLIRSYAMEYEPDAGRAFTAANRRILMDSQAGLFVTAFYGILDPISGELTYTNAGHNPPYLLHPEAKSPTGTLARTGVPLGLFEEQVWEQESVQIAHGDTLVLYTDGITEAQNPAGEFYDEERLLDTIRANLGRSAVEIRDALLSAVSEFQGEADQFDDLTLVVVVRE